jgi:hypothetical protein
LERKGRRLSEDFVLSTPIGVLALFAKYHATHEDAIRTANYDAVVMLVDVDQAVADAWLSWLEAYVVDLVYYGGWSVEETAGIIDIDEALVTSCLCRAAAKVSDYLTESEGYDRVA